MDSSLSANNNRASGGDSATWPEAQSPWPFSPFTNPAAILYCLRLPARLTKEQAAVLLGFQSHDISVLCRANLLYPLGQPGPSGTKYFETAFIKERARDLDWLAKATLAVGENWKRKNRKAPSKSAVPSINAAPKRRSRYAP